jgi:hypothetical protein
VRPARNFVLQLPEGKPERLPAACDVTLLISCDSYRVGFGLETKSKQVLCVIEGRTGEPGWRWPQLIQANTDSLGTFAVDYPRKVPEVFGKGFNVARGPFLDVIKGRKPQLTSLVDIFAEGKEWG